MEIGLNYHNQWYLTVNGKEVSWNTKHDDVISVFKKLGLELSLQGTNRFDSDDSCQPYSFETLNNKKAIKFIIGKETKKVKSPDYLTVSTDTIDWEKKTITYGSIQSITIGYYIEPYSTKKNEEYSTLFKALYEDLYALYGKPKYRQVDAAYPLNDSIPIDQALKRTYEKATSSADGLVIYYGFGKNAPASGANLYMVVEKDRQYLGIVVFPD